MAAGRAIVGGAAGSSPFVTLSLKWFQQGPVLPAGPAAERTRPGRWMRRWPAVHADLAAAGLAYQHAVAGWPISPRLMGQLGWVLDRLPRSRADQRLRWRKPGRWPRWLDTDPWMSGTAGPGGLGPGSRVSRAEVGDHPPSEHMAIAGSRDADELGPTVQVGWWSWAARAQVRPWLARRTARLCAEGGSGGAGGRQGHRDEVELPLYVTCARLAAAWRPARPSAGRSCRPRSASSRT